MAKLGPLGKLIYNLRDKLVDAAQSVLDEWQQDEEGFDEEYGTGGPCEFIAGAIGDVLAAEIEDIEFEEGGQDGDDHAFLVVSAPFDTKEYVVDIPPGVYESGGGYRWRKHADVVLDEDDIVIEPLE
jgi:hypothetical protein